MSNIELVRIYCAFLTILVILFFLFAGQSMSATKNSEVNATVGEFFLDLSGFVSPNASIVLTSQEQFLRSALADNKGDFFISQVPIKAGFASFCLEAVDFKRVGDSYTCFNIPPATDSVSKKDIFLPPTIGVSGKKLLPNSSLFAFGYTMPKASVLVHVGGGILLKATADSQGYYKVEIKDLVPGKYSLFATATYNGKDSEEPSKKLEIESLSEGGAIKENVTSLLEKLFQILLTFITLLITYIWVVLPILILIIILISKKLRDRLKNIAKRTPGVKEEKTFMHHSWLFGY